MNVELIFLNEKPAEEVNQRVMNILSKRYIASELRKLDNESNQKVAECDITQIGVKSEKDPPPQLLRYKHIEL
jgi:hypothetical protein